MADPWSLMDRFIPSEGADQKAVRKWRVSVGLSSLLFLMLLGTSPFWAPLVLMTDAEAQVKEQEIKKEFSSIRSEIKAIDTTVKELAETLTEAEEERKRTELARTIRELRQQIYSTQRDACLATDQVRSLLLQQVDELRSEFMAMTGTEYPRLDCAGF